MHESFKKLEVPSDFSNRFLIGFNRFSIPPPYKCRFSNFPTCSWNFHEKFAKVFKNLWKMAIFYLNYQKTVNFSLIFSEKLKTSPSSGVLRPHRPRSGDPPYKPSFGGPRFPAEKFLGALMASAMLIWMFKKIWTKGQIVTVNATTQFEIFWPATQDSPA